MADLEIQNAFLDGIEEIFSIMFTDDLQFSFLNTEATKTNVYGETPVKAYHNPIPLIGRITTTMIQGENPIETVQVDAVITIPTKQLVTKKIPHKTEVDLETLKRGKFSYKGIEYLVSEVKPKTLVADMWQMYDFMCSVDKKTSLGGV